jgi:RHS repeat-associated protein
LSNGVGKQNGDILDRDELNFPRLPHGIGTVPLASGTATQFTIITTAVAKSEFTYDPATLAVDTETISYDLDATAGYEFFRVLDRSRDALGHDTGFILGSTPAPGVGGGAPASTIVEAQAAYAYSPTDGRIAQISNPQIPNQAFIYQYLPNSDLIEKVTGPIHTVTNSWEPNRDVLDFKQNKVGTTIISSYDYAVNAIGQRTGVATSGTAYPAVPSWFWSYDALGQVTSADSSIATSDRAYQYDAIGNRQKTANSLTLPVANNYTANRLNQYTSFPSLASVPSYDFDGNMTSGPLPVSPTTNSTLLWDGENRLTEVKNSAGTTLEQNFFDAGSRKIATTANGITTLYLYDGWNCIAEYTRSVGVSATLQKTRLWGTDLSGSMQGAGGVGGILSESSPITSNPITFNSSYPTYDGNGNVSEYLDSTGQVIAHYEYDPFGNTVVNTDTSNQFSYRFSTKPIAFATGLYYYGYRYYDPLTGRWPSRDPMEEQGGVNLYGFVENDGVNRLDYLGQFGLSYTPPPNSSVTPFELGIEWLTGLGPRHRDFKDGDAFAEQMRSHNHIQTKIKEVTNTVTGKCNSDCKYTGPYSPPTSTSSYNLGGVEGVAKYLGDYSNLLTFGAFGNLAVTFTGSYGATFTVKNIDCCKNTADLEIVMNNRSHAASALRPPVLGYTDWWQTHIAPRVNQLFQSGPGSPTTQKVTLTETLTLSSDCPTK